MSYTFENLKNDLKLILDNGHIYLKKYRVIAIFIVSFFAWQCWELTTWYMGIYKELKEWQNAPVIGLVAGYVTALKFALEHILEDNDEE
jgi:hypothetical protein